MTLATIAAQLPNGFHDAHLRRLAVDYVDRRATLALDLSVGDVDADAHAEREAYRPAVITISGLLWCVIEAPKTNDESRDDLWIDAGPVSTLKKKPSIPASPEDAFAWWIFVNQWNAFIYIAARNASLEWQDEQR